MADMKQIHDFAVKWHDKFLDQNINYIELVDHFMADDCDALGFEMDCGHSFSEKYGQAVSNHEELGKIIDEITDIPLLGSAIYSRWRYFNHWAYDGAEILEPQNRAWFVLVLDRMAFLSKQQLQHSHTSDSTLAEYIQGQDIFKRNGEGHMKLGKLKEIPLREVWKHEQFSFSAWLATEENIVELGQELDLSLTDIETEKFVGNYRCDILCKDELTGKTVLIENQLEPTNHDHLGKIITYASGLDATVVVWIVETARSEHASAIEWLNKHTDDEISFFLIEVHAYKIGDSSPAPMFKIVEKPNDFVKSVRDLSKKGNLNESQIHRLEFWNTFNDVVDGRGRPFNKRKASTDHWYSVAIGSSQCHISIDLVNREHRIRVGVWIRDSKELYDKFYENKKQIEETLGIDLCWDRLDDKKASFVCTYIDGLDFSNKDNYADLMNKTIDTVISMRKVFTLYL